MKSEKKISRRTMLRRAAVAGGALCAPSLLVSCKTSPVVTTNLEKKKDFRAGASAVEITPKKFPISVSGQLQDRIATRSFDPLFARCLILDDGEGVLVIMICDSLALPHELLDEVKLRASQTVGIPPPRMLIAATNTHSAPTVFPRFQSDADAEYTAFLREQLVKAIEVAWKNLEPARVGWTVTKVPDQTHSRLWIMRKPFLNPFGRRTSRILIHPGHQNPMAIEPAGPMDTALTLLSVQSAQGRPMALLANYTLSYVRQGPFLSADYFGRFSRNLTDLMAKETDQPPFVAMMSNGAQGDTQCFDYSAPREGCTRESVAEALAQAAFKAYQEIKHADWVSLDSTETELEFATRRPSANEIATAKRILERAQGRALRGLREIFARETVLLGEFPPKVELKLQAMRIGALGIVALPVEAFAISGLEIKQRSPLQPTFAIGLANGYHGFAAPPAHHLLGGFPTWRSRSSFLPSQAASRMVDTAVELLEELAGATENQTPPLTPSDYSQVVLGSAPVAYWPMSELSGPYANDASGNSSEATYEQKILFHLPGPPKAQFHGFDAQCKAPYFFDHRMKARLWALRRDYSVAFWFCHRRHFDEQTVTSYLFSRGVAGGSGDHLGLTGTSVTPQRIFILNALGRTELISGRTDLLPDTWNHLVFTREGENFRVFLNGRVEITGSAPAASGLEATRLYIAGRSDGLSGFEGKICHLAVFNRALGADEVARHYSAAVGVA